jgi:hypothetical protein
MDEDEGDLKETENFWEKFETISIDLSKKLRKPEFRHTQIKPILKKKIKDPDSNKIKPTYLDVLNAEYRIERSSQLQQRLRESNIEATKSITIQVKNQTRKELLTTVIEIESQFQQEVYTMKTDQERMREELSSKTRAMNTFSSHLIVQSSTEDVFHSTEPAYWSNQSEMDENAKLEDLKKQFSVLSAQLDAIKALNSEYRDEAMAASNKLRNAEQDMQKLKQSHHLAVKNLERQIGSRENVVLDDARAISAAFEEYKSKIAKELQIRSLLEERQKEFIESLKLELKNAKTILQNPTLRMKTYEKLKQGKIKVNSDYVFPKIVTTTMSTKEGDARTLNSPVEQFTSFGVKSTRRAKSSFKP